MIEKLEYTEQLSKGLPLEVCVSNKTIIDKLNELIEEINKQEESIKAIYDIILDK